MNQNGPSIKANGFHHAYKHLNGATDTTESCTDPDKDDQSRKLFIVRHGERMDYAFGEWVSDCFDDNGNYRRKDLNMPPRLPRHKMGPKAFVGDTSLTQIGIYQARLVGEALRASNTTIEQVYCSPAFRCIQTCDSLLRGMGKQEELKIKVETGLFEWLFRRAESPPEWFTNEELVAAGYNIDTTYKPLLSRMELTDPNRVIEQFYMQTFTLTKEILDASTTGNVLFVAHSISLDACSRALVGKRVRHLEEVTQFLPKVTYCSVAALSKNGDKWEMVQSPCPPLTHTANQKFDWKMLQQSF